VVHLPDVGITDYGTLGHYGFYQHRVAPLEVCYNGKPLRLAQWPNEVCDLYYSLFYCYCISLFTGRA